MTGDTDLIDYDADAVRDKYEERKDKKTALYDTIKHWAGNILFLAVVIYVLYIHLIQLGTESGTKNSLVVEYE